MDLSKLPKVKTGNIVNSAKTNPLKRIPFSSSGKESLLARKTNLRRSKSFSDLQSGPYRRPISDRNGLEIHPALPKINSLKSSHSFIVNNKENKPVIKPTTAVKRPGGLVTSTASAPKQMKTTVTHTNSSTLNKAAANKRIQLTNFKEKYTELKKVHDPMEVEVVELRRNNTAITEELGEMRAQWESYSASLDEYKRNAEIDRTKILQLTSETCDLSHQLSCVTVERDDLRKQLEEIRNELSTTKQKLIETSHKLSVSDKKVAELKQLSEEQKIDIEELQESTQALHWERRNLHNKLQEMKGSIRVVCRVRPALALGRAVAALAFPDACTIELERYEPGAHRRLAKHDFKFDRVFGPTSSQEDVWEEVSCLVQSALDGYNVCIFAYGQTGSGKTYTMEGTGPAPGVIPRSCTMLFDSIRQLSKSGWSYTVYSSFLEIYNEQLYDLLQPSKDPKELDIRMADAKGSDVYITNLTEHEVKTADELLRLAARAQMNRQTAATKVNERSSRSHSVTRILLVGNHEGKSLSLVARLCLVDLAGSESAKNTTRMKETKNINKSLSELGQVILALQEKKEHVPYRNSKLTRLLEPQLGGAAKALLVAAAAPYEDCSHESLSTLRFATQVGHCSTAQARRNIALANPQVAQSNSSTK